jgi:cell division control protein 6
VAAEEHGDARRALDLLRVAGELAERESAARVTDDHIKAARERIEYDRVTEALRSLPVHWKLVVTAAYMINRRGVDAAVTGDVYNVYAELCAVSGLEALTQRRISGLISELDVMGILNTRVVSFGRYGRTKMIRVGIPGHTVVQVLSDDAFMSPLLSRNPACLEKRPPA